MALSMAEDAVTEMKSSRGKTDQKYHEILFQHKKRLKSKILLWNRHTLRQGRPTGATYLQLKKKIL